MRSGVPVFWTLMLMGIASVGLSLTGNGQRPAVDLHRAPVVAKAQDPLTRRFHPYLVAWLRQPRTAQAPRLLHEQARFHGFRWIGPRLHVRLRVQPELTERVEQQLALLDIPVHTVSRGEIEVLIEAPRLGDLARIPGVRYVTQPRWLRPLYTSEGLKLVGGDVWRKIPQVAGNTRTRVGIVDIGYKSYKELLDTELPPGTRVHTRNFRSDDNFESTDHGTAVAEVVTDFIREGDLYLTAVATTGELTSAILWLKDQGVQVISGSIGTSYRAGDGTGFGEYDAIDQAYAAGIVPVFAAGNEALMHWMADAFFDNDNDRWLNFAVNDELNCFTGEAGDEISLLLLWYDWPASTRDYDLFLFSWPDLTEVARSDVTQDGTQEPVESIDMVLSKSGTYCAAIYRYSGPGDVPLEMFLDSPRCGGFTPCFDFTVPRSSLSGPADGRNAIAVGAVIWDTDTLAPYSSRGPTLDGRRKPDISAPTHISTYTYGQRGFLFTGTSAATPHVSGAIALMHHKLLGPFSGTLIWQVLAPRALDRGPIGPDNHYGIGRLYMLAP